MLKRSLVFTILALGCLPANLAARTRVVTYVEEVQDERASTRWTLTEWLRIKERMKMMDVWLAMFSDPAKDRFQPELMLSYSMGKGATKLQAGDAAATSSSAQSSTGRAQLWLTNLVSSSVGVRTLNIDLGAEASRRVASHGASASAPQLSLVSSSGNPAERNEYYSGNLRIFGRSVQDSSIVLKYGKYLVENPLLSTIDSAPAKRQGTLTGGELQLYVWRWLGAEGNYLDFAQHGAYFDYQGFIEISLLRVSAGVYQRSARGLSDERDLHSLERGTLATLKLQL